MFVMVITVMGLICFKIAINRIVGGFKIKEIILPCYNCLLQTGIAIVCCLCLMLPLEILLFCNFSEIINKTTLNLNIFL